MAWAHKFNFPTASWDPSGATSTSRAETAGSAVAVGDVVVAWVTYRFSGDSAVTLTDNLGNTYTEDTNTHYYEGAVTAHVGVRGFYSRITNAGTPTLTASFGGGANAVTFPGIFATVRTGLTATPFQVSATPRRVSGVAGSTDALATNAANVTTPPALVDTFAYGVSASGGYTLTAGTGFTSRLTGQNAGANRHHVRTADKRVTAGGNTTATWTPNFGGVDCVALQMVFTELNVDPIINTASSMNPTKGSSVTFSGNNYGASFTGSASVVIGGVAHTPTSWSNTDVTVALDEGANLFGVSVDVVITNSTGVASPAFPLTSLQPQSGWAYTNLTSVNTTAAYRIQSVADVATGNQVHYDTVGGKFTVLPDGSILATDYGTFSARVGVSPDGWGTYQTQSVLQLGGGTAGRNIRRSLYGSLVYSFKL